MAWLRIMGLVVGMMQGSCHVIRCIGLPSFGSWTQVTCASTASYNTI